MCYRSVRIYDFDSACHAIYVYIHLVTLSCNKQPATFIVTYHLNFLFGILFHFHSPSGQGLKLHAMLFTAFKMYCRCHYLIKLLIYFHFSVVYIIYAVVTVKVRISKIQTNLNNRLSLGHIIVPCSRKRTKNKP